VIPDLELSCGAWACLNRYDFSTRHFISLKLTALNWTPEISAQAELETSTLDG